MSLDIQLQTLNAHRHAAARLGASRFGGRPTKYRAQFAELAHAMLTDPRTLASLSYIASIFGIARSTLHVWMKRFPEFGKAIDAGKLEQERQLAMRLLDGTENPQPIIFILKNRHGWRDEQVLESGGDKISALILNHASTGKVDWLTD